MEISQDHRRYAQECVAMAQASEDTADKALWLTLAQSWLRLAEHVAHLAANDDAELDEEALAARASD
jgi:hypothetical protein